MHAGISDIVIGAGDRSPTPPPWLMWMCVCQNIHTSHIRFGDVVVLTTTFIGRRGHATYDHPGATRGSRLRVTVHTSRGEELLRGVTRTSSFHPRSSRPIRFLRISYHTRHPSRAPAPCLGHQLPRPEPLRSPTGTSTTILARERSVLCYCGCARLFAHKPARGFPSPEELTFLSVNEPVHGLCLGTRIGRRSHRRVAKYGICYGELARPRELSRNDGEPSCR